MYNFLPLSPSFPPISSPAPIPPYFPCIIALVASDVLIIRPFTPSPGFPLFSTIQPHTRHYRPILCPFTGYFLPITPIQAPLVYYSYMRILCNQAAICTQKTEPFFTPPPHFPPRKKAGLSLLLVCTRSGLIFSGLIFLPCLRLIRPAVQPHTYLRALSKHTR